MKGLVIVGDYFEDTELIATIDVLLRHGEHIDIVSMMNTSNVTSKCGISMNLKATIEEVNLDDYDFLFVPGGPGSFQILAHLSKTSEVINHFVEANKLVASICAAPMLVGRLGHFKGRFYTVYPGFEKDIVGGTYLQERGIVRDGNFITGRSMYYSIPMGLAIIEFFYGKDEKEKLEESLQARK